MTTGAAAVAVRRDPRLHAAVVLPAEALGRGAAAVRRRAAVRAARPRRRRHRRASVRQRRRRGHLRARDADRRARHRRLRARRRGARRHVPLHVAVARRRPGRSCSAAGWAARSSRSSRSPRRARSPRSSPARPTSAGPAFVAAAVGSVVVRRACSSPSAASRGAPRCGRWRSCSSSSGCSARRSPASPSSRRRGSRGRSSSASSTTRRAASSATASPQGGAAVVRLVDRHGRRAGRRQLADAPPAPVRRRRLTPASDSRSNRPLFGLRHRIRRSSPGSVTQTGGSVGVDWPLRSSVGGANICS